MTDDTIIRQMRQEETAIPIEWARQEGWNPGIHDASCHYPVDPAGWLCAEKDEEIIGVIVGTNYDNTFAFWGFYIMKEGYRNQGTGWALFQKMREHVGDRNLGCDGVYAMQNTYHERAGLQYAYRNIRWQGVSQSGGQGDLVPASDIPFSSLLTYDTTHFPVERRVFLERWVNQPEGTALVKVDRDDEVIGYGVIRRCFEGHKIGPIFADNDQIADELFDGLTATIPGETVFFDTPEPNTRAVEMATRRGMTEVFGTARMYSGSAPSLPVHEIFGVTTFELG